MYFAIGPIFSANIKLGSFFYYYCLSDVGELRLYGPNVFHIPQIVRRGRVAAFVPLGVWLHGLEIQSLVEVTRGAD